jgi:hypothetical protein
VYSLSAGSLESRAALSEEPKELEEANRRSLLMNDIVALSYVKSELA